MPLGRPIDWSTSGFWDNYLFYCYLFNWTWTLWPSSPQPRTDRHHRPGQVTPGRPTNWPNPLIEVSPPRRRSCPKRTTMPWSTNWRRWGRKSVPPWTHTLWFWALIPPCGALNTIVFFRFIVKVNRNYFVPTVYTPMGITNCIKSTPSKKATNKWQEMSISFLDSPRGN